MMLDLNLTLRKKKLLSLRMVFAVFLSFMSLTANNAKVANIRDILYYWEKVTTYTTAGSLLNCSILANTRTFKTY